jgi:hypothetical protein
MVAMKGNDIDPILGDRVEAARLLSSALPPQR